ncbi:MAG: FAD-dependent oxidoreductase [Gemmatimonadales bacterium]|nr:FAD-dependent oxidoreductase [Gemmatimonadales bacterium]
MTGGGRRAVVVGAGIAGLAAAWELLQAGLDVMVLESEQRAGGMIVTERRDGFVVEGGPDSWLAAEPEIPALASALGVADQVVAQTARGSWLWTGRALEPLEEGRAAALLGIQAKGAELAAGFRSFAGGMGALVEALLGRVGSCVRPRLGVTAVTPDAGRWRLAVTGGATIEGDGVVLALPAFAAGRLLEQAGVTNARALGAVTYYPSVTVSLAYAASQVGGGGRSTAQGSSRRRTPRARSARARTRPENSRAARPEAMSCCAHSCRRTRATQPPRRTRSWRVCSTCGGSRSGAGRSPGPRESRATIRASTACSSRMCGGDSRACFRLRSPGRAMMVLESRPACGRARTRDARSSGA